MKFETKIYSILKSKINTNCNGRYWYYITQQAFFMAMWMFLLEGNTTIILRTTNRTSAVFDLNTFRELMKAIHW